MLNGQDQRKRLISLVPTDHEGDTDPYVYNARLSSCVDRLHNLRKAGPLQIQEPVNRFGVVGDGDVLDLRHANTLRQRHDAMHNAPYPENVRLAGRTDYALRAVLEIAAAHGEPQTTDEIAASQQIPARYLGAILADLRRADIVHARRGAEGGWTLARPAEAISLAAVIRAVDGALAQVAGTRPEDLHYEGTAAGLQEVWVALRAAEREILDSVTLAHVAEGQLPEKIHRLTKDPAAWH